MSTVEELVATARKNEVIAKNLFEIEVAIMNITQCSSFFETLLRLIQEKFNIDYAWIALTEVPHNDELISALRSIPETDGRTNLQTLSTLDFLQATKSVQDPILANRDIPRFRRLIPKELLKEVASLAVLPLIVDKRIIGGVVLGSLQQDRYDPKKDSFFLKQLSVKASISLAGVWARQRIGFLATRDPLTQLRNRRELEETLEQELSRHARHRQNMAVMFIDCDDFKIVNDTFGHDCGDMYLKHVAFHLDELTRKSDLAFRFAGDEFVIVLPSQNQEGADIIAQRIREYLLEHPLKYQDQSIPVVISYGVVSTEIMQQVDSKSLLKWADERLYDMKKNKASRNDSRARPVETSI